MATVVRPVLEQLLRMPHDSNIKSEPRTGIVSETEGLQLHRRRNFFQLLWLIVFSGVGAMIGHSMTNNRPDLAAILGGLVGAVFGTFVSGLCLMFVPPPLVVTTLDECRDRYLRVRQRVRVAVVAATIGLCGIPLVIRHAGQEDSVIAWSICMVWSGVTLALSFYTRLLWHRILTWKCPVCMHRIFPSSGICSNCGVRMTA